MDNPLVALSNELADAAECTGRAVVAVHGRPRISSSGVLWQNGIVVTAEHALRRGEDVRVTLPDGKTVAAELAGRDPGTDLAVLKVDAAAPVADGMAAHPTKTGQLVLAIGRSEETGISAALGVVSNVSGPWHTWRGGRIDQLLRLDLALHPSASGGAIVDAEGKLVGMATAGLSRTSIFAIPVATIKRVAGELLEKGHIVRGYLGVGLQPIALPEHLKAKPEWVWERKGGPGGLIVLSVERDGPAGRAGIVIGDILIAFDGKPILDTDDVQAFLSMEYVGQPVKASIMRGGKLTELTINIGERPRREA
jgi:S1-C subfamily serine protease